MARNLEVQSKVLVANNKVEGAIMLNKYSNLEFKREPLLFLIKFDNPWCCIIMFKMAAMNPDALIFTLIDNN